ncbi:hypothetical protein GE09DRAFT_1109882 [Coniochaeta sp. 2T2.1]|nr:hypothetical protein GE09DRAFT_1109882 [Coniochaeta sp. 2T2.1]
MAESRGKEREVAREASKVEPRYEVYVRLPFNRGDFVDPPPVDWDDSKSDALWNIISEVERAERKIDCNATSFGVGVDFLLMIAQTLAERHTNQLMGLFRKAAASTSASGTASPINAGFPAGASLPDAATGATSESMRRTASGSGNRPSSPASIRRDSPLLRTDTPLAGTPLKTSLTAVRPSISSRSATPSIPTQVLAQNLASSGSTQTKRPKSPLLPRHRPSNLHLSTTSPPPQDPNSPDPTSPAKSSESDSSSSSSSPVESRIIKRPPRPGPKMPSTSVFSEDDDEAEPAFLPYQSPAPAAKPAASANSSDLGATLKGAPSSRRPGSKAAATAFLSSREGSEVQGSHTSDSSTSSAQPKRALGKKAQGQTPLSPRRTAELAGRSPAGKGSDGTPSMGSSFSDLDDASVTQSALEEALASNMQDGGATVGSRMSTFGNAFKSRYLPKGNR